MEASIVKIGNSQGLIIPRKVLTSLGNAQKFDIELRDGGLFIMPSKEHKPRYNWDAQFAKAINDGHSPETNDYIENEFDKEEWTW